MIIYYMVSLHDWENNTVAKIESLGMDMNLSIMAISEVVSLTLFSFSLKLKLVSFMSSKMASLLKISDKGEINQRCIY